MRRIRGRPQLGTSAWMIEQLIDKLMPFPPVFVGKKALGV